MQSSAELLLAHRTFKSSDQDLFARLTGDVNPIHMDSLAARRSIVGAVVVHGMHTTSWILDVVAKSQFRPVALSAFDVRFPKPLYLGEEVTLTLGSVTDHEIRLTARVGVKVVASVRLACLQATMLETQDIEFSEDFTTVAPSIIPDDIAFDTVLGKAGHVEYASPQRDFAIAFPYATGLVGAARLRGLGACSRLVGMYCPGLRSVFSRLTVELSEKNDSPNLAYEVVHTDSRFNLIRMQVAGARLVGQVEAFSPSKAALQTAISDLATLVDSRAFEGQTALVIGGSRGLGELTAKLVAAGGGRALITYALGQNEAAHVTEEIRNFGGDADAFPYDVTQPTLPQLRRLNGRVPTHVYYFATSRISQAKCQPFEPDLLAKFMAYYADGFYALCRGLWESNIKSLSILYPSTIFVEERPRDLTEYAMAKAAGEVLCSDIPRIMPGIRVYVRRLPRLLTDQTMAVIPQNLPNPIHTIFPILKEMR